MEGLGALSHHLRQVSASSQVASRILKNQSTSTLRILGTSQWKGLNLFFAGVFLGPQNDAIFEGKSDSYLIGQWLNFKLFGITVFSREDKPTRTALFQGPGRLSELMVGINKRAPLRLPFPGWVFSRSFEKFLE